MTRLQSEDLSVLLRKVNEGHIIWHDCTDVHAPGFAWIGADMSEEYRELCGQAYHARLIDIGSHHAGASAVSLTVAGVERLAQLQSRHNETVRGVA